MTGHSYKTNVLYHYDLNLSQVIEGLKIQGLTPDFTSDCLFSKNQEPKVIMVWYIHILETIGSVNEYHAYKFKLTDKIIQFLDFENEKIVRQIRFPTIHSLSHSVHGNVFKKKPLA